MINSVCVALGVQVKVDGQGTVTYRIISPGKNGSGIISQVYFDMIHLKNIIKGSPILYNGKGERVVNQDGKN